MAEIDLSKNNIKEKSMNSLCESLNNVRYIKSLNLSNCNLTINSISTLMKCFSTHPTIYTRLEELNLSGKNFHEFSTNFKFSIKVTLWE